MSRLDELAVERTATAQTRMTTRQKQTLVLLLGAQFMLAADFTILTIALPVIGDDLGFTLGNLQWITTGFALPAAGFTLLFGRAADLVGRRKVFLTGIGLLTVASLVGGFAASPAMLIAARVGQGLAMAITMPSALSLLTTSFPEGKLRERALGLNGSLLGAGFTVGALVGGTLTDVLSWRWSFLINVPIAIAIFIGSLLVIEDRAPTVRTRLDVPGAVTVTCGLLALVYGITTAGRAGWGDPVVYVSLAIAVGLLVGFWFIERRSPSPLAPIGTLRRKTVAWGNFGGVVTAAMGTGISFLMTLYMQKVLHFSPLAAGIALGLPGLTTVIGGPVAARYVGRIGGPATLAISLAVQFVVFGLLVMIGANSAWIGLVIVSLCIGYFAHAFGLVSYMTTATSGVPDEEQGLATGLTTMSLQMGITVGIPVLSAIAIARTEALQGSTSEQDAILGGLHASTIATSVIFLVSALLIWFALRHKNTRTPASAEA